VSYLRVWRSNRPVSARWCKLYFMKQTLAFGFIIAILVVLFSSSAQAGIGSCYEVKPICMQGQAVCLCNQYNQCFWACR
jgi:hypothetical protein